MPLKAFSDVHWRLFCFPARHLTLIGPRRFPPGAFVFSEGVKVGSLADGVTAVWSIPQFWELLPITIFVLLFGFVISVAVVRARREDIPRILAILSAFFSSVFARREYRSPSQGRRWQDVVTGNAEPSVVVHSKQDARQGEEVQG